MFKEFIYIVINNKLANNKTVNLFHVYCLTTSCFECALSIHPKVVGSSYTRCYAHIIKDRLMGLKSDV